MFDFQRLAKEDYEVMGRSHVWTFWDTGTLLSSFEMEVSGGFGKSMELVLIRRFPPAGDFTDIEKVFHEKWSKWTDWLLDEMHVGTLAYVNVPDRSVPDELPKEGETSVDQDRGTVSKDELLIALSGATEAGKIDIDIVKFCCFLRGEGTAPARYVVDNAAKMVPVRDKKIKPKKKNKKQSARGKAGADSRWSETIKTKSVIKEHSLEMDRQGCTCNHVQLAIEIHEYAIGKDGNALLGSSEIALYKVRETVKKLFQDKAIKRVKGVDVFKDEPACKVHNPYEYEKQKQEKF